MDAATKKKLIDKLADAKNFDKLYPQESRRWFVDRLIRTYEAQNLGDAQITTKVTEVVTKSKPIVKAKRDFEIGLKFGKSLKTIQAGRRIEILYGAIASDPDFVDPANSAVLDWIAKRRLRSVSRMDFFVNPNSQGYFRYPKTCPTNQRWRVNVDAKAYWQDSPAPPSNQFPFLLKRPAGGPDYVKAINSIFKSKKKACDGNLLDCATTLGAVFLDSLQEAKDTPKLLKKVDDSRGVTNLAIHHADGIGATVNMLTDTGPEGLFVRRDTLVYDLQVGDHAYVYNHPLYKVFEPDGSWRGEHSLVYNAGDRQAKSRKGIVFGGHGMEGTVYQFYDSFLTELQTHLHRAFRIGAVFLVWMQTDGASLPPNRVTQFDTTWNQPQTGTVPVTFYEFDVTFKYNNYKKAPTRSNPRPTKTEQDFVIWHFPTLNAFLIDKLKTIAAVLNADQATDPIQFRRTNIGADEFEPVDWAIEYFDQSTGTNKFFSPFQRQNGKLSFKQLSIDALFESPFGKRDPKKEEIDTTKPRASLTAQYRSFLSTNGAI